MCRITVLKTIQASQSQKRRLPFCGCKKQAVKSFQFAAEALRGFRFPSLIQFT